MNTSFRRGLPHVSCPQSRRDFLRQAGAGFGAVALAGLLGRSGSAAEVEAPPENPLAPRLPHFPTKAKSVIWVFIDGGPSHIELFDPKPQLNRLAGQPLPGSFEKPVTAMGVTAHAPLLGSRRKFGRYGENGLWLSDWVPHLQTCADDICVVRSCVAEGLTHVAAVTQMNSGTILGGRPSVGAWSLYGLGSECEDLPGYVVLCDRPSDPPGGNRNWGTGFMPASFQGTRFRDGKSPILHVSPPDGYTDARQRSKIKFIQQLNNRFKDDREEDDTLDARIAAYELAYRMQMAAPEVTDLSEETEETRRLYGLDQEATAANGRNCLMARRLVERGVRFVQLYTGTGSRWDAHKDVEGNHTELCGMTDQPVAALIKDLKRRGLLDSTLVVWGGEFGRTPMSESGDGRDHNPYGFTMWMAGGGVKPGFVYGATDEIGLYAIENRAHIHDIHATILHLLGLNHENLTFEHNGRDERLTIVSGEVMHGIVA